jgi:hypothetical protein
MASLKIRLRTVDPFIDMVSAEVTACGDRQRKQADENSTAHIAERYQNLHNSQLKLTEFCQRGQIAGNDIGWTHSMYRRDATRI